jgi:hypothetical protein
MTSQKINGSSKTLPSISDKREKIDAINLHAFEIRNTDTQRSISLSKIASFPAMTTKQKV